MVRNKLMKTSIPKPIDPECRLVATLMYLSQGVSPNYLTWAFRMGVSTVRAIICEVCQVLWDVLLPKYMPELHTGDWKEIAENFSVMWQMPNCVGSLDGKHVQIKCPPKSGSKFYNYKGFYSVVLLGICDANYTFTAVDVGAFGSQSDGGVLKNGAFGQKVLNNTISLPAPKRLPNSSKISPYYFVADSAFPLRENIMRPYPGILLNLPEDVFNTRLSRARGVIENTLGILTARCRIFGKCIDLHPKNADKIVLACTILHNFLKITDTQYQLYSYCPEQYCHSFESEQLIEGTWRGETKELLQIRPFGSNNRSTNAFKIRKLLTHYFMNEGKVSFQPH